MIVVRYSWAACLSFALLLAGFGWIAGTTAAGLSRTAPGLQITDGMNSAWLAWILVGVLMGRDLTWQIRMERLKIFPLHSFVRLYLLCFLLSFASYPLLVVLLAIIAGGWTAGCLFPAGWAASLGAYVLFVGSVHSAVSTARTLFQRWRGLPRIHRSIASSIVLILAFVAAASVFRPVWARVLPGYSLGAVLRGGNPIGPLVALALAVFLTSAADFLLQRHVTYSGANGSSPGGGHLAARGRILSYHASWPTTLWRISLLGWMRNRNAVLLLLWGTGYGFSYLFLTRPDGAFDFALFCWLVLVFHSYLRGNLLGVDHRAAWAYFMLPVPVGEVVRSKNRTLTLLQGCMVIGVLLPGWLHPVPGMDGVAWLRIALCAYSSILLSEIVGGISSLTHPEPIERSCHFSGGFTLGGLIIPPLLAAFLILFMVSTGAPIRRSAPALFWLVAAGVPALLVFARSALLPGWLQTELVRRRATILARLSVFSS